MSDRATIQAQIQRPIRADSTVVARCHLGMPVIVEVPPILDDGTPFPTRFWLTCPLAVRRIGRLEASGGVKRMEAKAGADPEFAARLEEANRVYARERDALVPDGARPRPTGGVGGVRIEEGSAPRVKCLHAHYAHHVAARPIAINPVGDLVAGWIEPLDCEIPCVVDGERNPEWKPRP